MRGRIILILAVVISTQWVLAEKVPWASDSVLAAITARGRMLEEYDVASWHATDAVMALNPEKDSAQHYFARKSGNAWVVVFGHLNAAGDKFLILYEATQGSTSVEFKARKVDPPAEDTEFYLAAARSLDKALHDFQAEKRPYNAYVFPSESNQLYVYLLPAQTNDDIYPLGGDARYLFTADGNTMLEKRQMHKTILETKHSEASGKTVAGFHTHVLSDIPEDSDVFHVLTQKPAIPEFVRCGKHTYTVLVDGTIVRAK